MDPDTEIFEPIELCDSFVLELFADEEEWEVEIPFGCKK